ncbi:MAG: hypothetical protein WCT01_01990 [Candidatus Shapirobacteria bacterium]|jgi:hypothetical protein
MENMSQIKLNLPIELKVFVAGEAKSNGLTIASYLRYLIMAKKEEREIREFLASNRLENKAIEAKSRFKQRVKVKNIDEFFATI